MSDLIAFITARLDEDEAAAKAAADADGADWHLGSTEDDDKRSIRHTGPTGLGALVAEWDFCVADRVDEDTAAYLARHDPARVLREVAAKRAILALHSRQPGQHPDFCGHDLHVMPCPTLRHIAAVDSDHPDYSEAVRHGRA